MAESGQLRQARAQALELLERDAQLAELREAALNLGAVLVETADDEDLWARLAHAGERVRTLTDKQRLGLRAALSINWAALLDDVGYQPPPPSELYATEFEDAIKVALESRDAAHVESARERLRALGQTLAELSGQEDVSPSRLRRWLRRGVRVAGTVLVVVGVAAAGVALVSAASAAVPVSSFLLGVGVDLLKDVTVRVLDSTLDRVLPGDGDESDSDAASDRKALESLYGIRDGEIGRLVSDWDAPAELLSPQPVERTCQVVEHAMRALYRAWEAAIGAPWYTAELAEHFHMLGAGLQHVRSDLGEEEPNAAAVADALRHVGEVLWYVKALLGKDIEPPNHLSADPD